MKKILLLILFISPLLLNAQQIPQTSSFDLLEQETGEDKCSDGCDNDGDGFIDCADLDCYLSFLKGESLKGEESSSRSRNFCGPDNACLTEYAEFINVLGISDVATAKDICSKVAELSEMIANNEYILIEECLNEASDNIPDWSDLASFIPGDNITQIIDERGNGDWQIQNITEASGAILNVDFFGVEFESLPEGISAEDFFENVRQMLQELDNTCFNQFEFNEETLDAHVWLSDNPLGTVFDIDILGPDNGAVIVSQYDNSPTTCSCWNFSTITNNSVGEHPVSGNRQFGMYQNSVGKWVFYTRGVDRAIDNLPFALNSRFGFMMADNLWNCLMENVQKMVDPDQSNSRIIAENYRPDWDKVKKEILNRPVSEILSCVKN